MKLIYSILSLLLSTSLWGQYLSVFGDSINSWHIIPVSNCETISTYTLSNTADTVIDSVAYKCFNEYLPYYNAKIIVREALSSGRIYLYNPVLKRELIITDMTLKKGDEFNIYSHNFTDSTLVKVDSVYRKNEVKHIRFNKTFTEKCNITNDTIIWFEFIEGTGSNAGIIYDINKNANSILLSQNKDNKKTYSYFDKISKYEHLNIYTDEQNFSFVNVVQIPKTHKASVEFPFKYSPVATFEIMDTKGNILYEMNPIDEKIIIFDFKYSGVYYLNITFNKIKYCKIIDIE